MVATVNNIVFYLPVPRLTSVANLKQVTILRTPGRGRARTHTFARTRARHTHTHLRELARVRGTHTHRVIPSITDHRRWIKDATLNQYLPLDGSIALK